MIDHEYPGRFALVDQSAKEAVQIPSDWIWRQFGGFCLATDPQLPVLEIKSCNHDALGWLLGYPILPGAQTMLSQVLEVQGDTDPLNADPIFFENDLYQLGGRFAAIVMTKGWRRYYPDASGSLAAFLCGDQKVIASTPSMIRGLPPVDADVAAALDRATQASGTWYPMGLCGFHGTSVVLPNHHVDLETWTAHRHWPVNDPLLKLRPTKHLVREIFDTLRSTIAAVAQRFPMEMDLTGGNDSRMMLAAALPYKPSIEFRTNLEHSPADGLLSDSLSRFFGLKHNSAAIDSRERVLLRGYGGEVGRCFYWKKCPGSQRPTAEQLLQGLGFPEPHRAMIAEADRWLAGVPGLDREAVLDLAYIEQRLGTTMSHVLYNSDTKHRFAMFPFNHRGIYRRMLSLPHEFRRQQRLASEICRLGSPMLNLFPINCRHFTGLTKYKKYCGYLRRRGSMSDEQRALVRNYCTCGRTLVQMLRDDLIRKPMAPQPNRNAEITTP